MIDFHCHLDLYPDPHEAADEAQRRDVGVLSVTTTPSAWPGTSRLAQGRPTIRTALGLHPQLAGQRKRELHLFDKYLPETRFVGEVGLDGSPEFRAAWPDQLEVFEHVLRECDRAGGRIVSIHSRRAASDVLDRLDRYIGVSAPLLHWFSGTKAELARAVSSGCWFSVGPAMLAGSKGRSLVASIPQNRVVLETDGPFARVQRTSLQPWDISLAQHALGQIWGVDEESVARILKSNEMSLLA